MAASAIQRPRVRLILGGMLTLLVGAACSTAVVTTTPAPAGSASTAPTSEGSPSPLTGGGDGPSSIFRELNPNGPKDLEVDAGYFKGSPSRDAFRPIYDSSIAKAVDAQLDADELVIGVSIGSQARAYPIRTLRIREMVNDKLGDTPILVTW